MAVCNGLGLWLRKEQELSPSNSTTSPTTDQDDFDSDEEDFSDDIDISADSSSMDIQSSSLGTDDGPINTSGQSSINSIDDDDDDCAASETSSDEEMNDQSIDTIDHWCVDIDEDPDRSASDEVQKSVGRVMKKCRSLVKFINKSSIVMNRVSSLKDQFKIRRSLQLDCKSRWNSSHRLVKSMLIYKKILNKLFSEKRELNLNKKQTIKLSSLEFDRDDWKMLATIESVLKPFVHATTMISGSKYPTIGISYFAITQIYEFLDGTTDVRLENWRVLSHLKSRLLPQINKYFTAQEKQWRLMKVRISQVFSP